MQFITAVGRSIIHPLWAACGRHCSGSQAQSDVFLYNFSILRKPAWTTGWAQILLIICVYRCSKELSRLISISLEIQEYLHLTAEEIKISPSCIANISIVLPVSGIAKMQITALGSHINKIWPGKSIKTFSVLRFHSMFCFQRNLDMKPTMFLIARRIVKSLLWL